METTVPGSRRSHVRLACQAFLVLACFAGAAGYASAQLIDCTMQEDPNQQGKCYLSAIGKPCTQSGGAAGVCQTVRSSGLFFHCVCGAPFTPTSTPTPKARPLWTGDCSGDGVVTVNEVITMVDIDLGLADLSTCPAADENGDGAVTIDELIKAINNILNGCSVPTPTSVGPKTPTGTNTATQVATPTNTPLPGTTGTSLPTAALSTTVSPGGTPPTPAKTPTETATATATATHTSTATATRTALEACPNRRVFKGGRSGVDWHVRSRNNYMVTAATGTPAPIIVRGGPPAQPPQPLTPGQQLHICDLVIIPPGGEVDTSRIPNAQQSRSSASTVGADAGPTAAAPGWVELFKGTVTTTETGTCSIDQHCGVWTSAGVAYVDDPQSGGQTTTYTVDHSPVGNLHFTAVSNDPTSFAPVVFVPHCTPTKVVHIMPGQARTFPVEDCDGDGVLEDNCPTVANSDQKDSDGDFVGDACDDCPTVPDSDQTNSSDTAMGDACRGQMPTPTPPIVLVSDLGTDNGCEEDGKQPAYRIGEAIGVHFGVDGPAGQEARVTILAITPDGNLSTFFDSLVPTNQTLTGLAILTGPIGSVQLELIPSLPGASSDIAVRRCTFELGAGMSCGGFQGTPCPAQEFCDLPVGTCNVADQTGICFAKPSFCPSTPELVCGCDGQTYSNECLREKAGVSKAHDGACGPTSGG